MNDLDGNLTLRFSSMPSPGDINLILYGLPSAEALYKIAELYEILNHS